ncbi:MAG TPA: ion transporter, partial [Candidatus Latescibacteria bacterium]|nr:ion transporter [Candidatus Latescibacterota bacterium]
VLLIVSISLSVLVVMLDSVATIERQHGDLLLIAEWSFTTLFTIEYLMRLICVGRPLGYAYSLFGIVDLLSILPTYLSLFLPGTHYLVVIRILRVLRIFRVLKLVQYISESRLLIQALYSSRRKITVFLLAVLTLVVILGSLMYVIEGEEHGFTSIPRSIYWAIVTLTTVGYGDISPQTALGQSLSAVVMILGYSIIAVPTGIISAELTQAISSRSAICPKCSLDGHDSDARFCKNCGAEI